MIYKKNEFFAENKGFLGHYFLDIWVVLVYIIRIITNERLYYEKQNNF